MLFEKISSCCILAIEQDWLPGVRGEGNTISLLGQLTAVNAFNQFQLSFMRLYIISHIHFGAIAENKLMLNVFHYRPTSARHHL